MIPSARSRRLRKLALHYMYYNFGRVHQTLRVTPAMEAGIADHVWSTEEIIALLDAQLCSRSHAGFARLAA